jgi:hypothetical protein
MRKIVAELSGKGRRMEYATIRRLIFAYINLGRRVGSILPRVFKSKKPYGMKKNNVLDFDFSLVVIIG